MMRTHETKSMLRSCPRSLVVTVAFALCFISVAELFAAVPGGGSSTCYNCRSRFGTWMCDDFGTRGGRKCVIDQDSCSIVGDCRSGSKLPFSATLPLDVIFEVAQVDAGAAATLVRLRQMGDIPAQANVSWMSGAISLGDVTSLVAGGQIQSDPSRLSSYDVYVEVLDDETTALTVSPAETSEAQSFQELAILFQRDPATGEQEVKDWFLH